MGKEQYDKGELVPEEICSVPRGWVFVRFAVDVEISQGYGGLKHIYPMEQVEETADLFATKEDTVQQVLSDDVTLYTTPRQMLR